MYCGSSANNSLHCENQPSQRTKGSCARTSIGIQGGNEVNSANNPEYAMAAVKIVQPAMTATTQLSDLDRLTRRTLKAAKTTSGRRVKPIAMSIGMGDMGAAYHTQRHLLCPITLTLASP